MKGQRPDLIPHVSFIMFDTVTFEDGAEFVAEIYLAVMLFLVVDVSDECVEVRSTEDECAVASLPCEG